MWSILDLDNLITLNYLILLDAMINLPVSVPNTLNVET